MLTHVDLFSGIGGFALAAEWAGFETIVFCEKDEYCQKVLKKRWPKVPIISEIRDFKWPLEDALWRGKKPRSQRRASDKPNQIRLLTGGFPCQPFSVAGKRRGKEDDRYLWPEMFTVISQVRPVWVLAENVTGIVNMELDKCLSDLESADYETGTFIIPACAVDAPHRRDRVWIVAYNEGGKSRESETGNGGESPCGRSEDVADAERSNEQGGCLKKQGQREFGGQDSRGIIFDPNRKRLEREIGNYEESTKSSRWSVEPNVGRVAHGIPSRVDRLKSLGNAIVPQVAYEIMRVIRMIEEGNG